VHCGSHLLRRWCVRAAAGVEQSRGAQTLRGGARRRPSALQAREGECSSRASQRRLSAIVVLASGSCGSATTVRCSSATAAAARASLCCSWRHSARGAAALAIIAETSGPDRIQIVVLDVCYEMLHSWISRSLKTRVGPDAEHQSVPCPRKIRSGYADAVTPWATQLRSGEASDQWARRE
jgi:hypothetical protein